MNVKHENCEEIANFRSAPLGGSVDHQLYPASRCQPTPHEGFASSRNPDRLGHDSGGALSVHGDGRPVARLRIGSNCWINASCVFDASSSIDIGNSVALGQGVMILTNSHEIGPSRDRAGTKTSLPVIIGDGVWIGARATVLPGVTIGSGAIVAAGALVNRSVEPDSLVGGLPARLIRKLDRR